MKENPNKIYLKLKSLSWGKKVLTAFAIAGFFLALFAYKPNISIFPGQTLDPYNPFKTPFILKNNGHLFIKNINYSLKVTKVETISGGIFENGSITNIINSFIPKIRSGRSSPIDMSRHITLPPNYIKTAEIYLKLSYNSFHIPYTFNDSIRFKTHRNTKGQYFWIEYYNE